MSIRRRSFLVHVYESGQTVVVEDLASHERSHGSGLAEIGAMIARWAPPGDDAPPAPAATKRDE
jgi:hypothetical protein